MKRERIEALDGKKIVFESDLLWNAVVSIDPDVGLTIEDTTSDVYLLCVNGPSSAFNPNASKANKEQWEAILNVVVPMLETGSFSAKEFEEKIIKALPELMGRISGGASAETCAFAQ